MASDTFSRRSDRSRTAVSGFTLILGSMSVVLRLDAVSVPDTAARTRPRRTTALGFRRRSNPKASKPKSRPAPTTFISSSFMSDVSLALSIPQNLLTSGKRVTDRAVGGNRFPPPAQLFGVGQDNAVHALARPEGDRRSERFFPRGCSAVYSFPSNRSRAQQPSVCGPDPCRCPSRSASAQPVSSSISASIGNSLKHRPS